MPTGLPGASFFLGIPYAPVRRMVDAGLGVALASDYNPGSSPSGNMRLVMALGCIRMRLTPAEALNATTLNGAAAMNAADEYGSITCAPATLAGLLPLCLPNSADRADLPARAADRVGYLRVKRSELYPLTGAIRVFFIYL